MKVQSLLASKANTKVMVNGTIYDIDANCCIEDVSEEDAEKLLSSKNWVKFGERRPVKSGKAQKSGKVVLLNSGGQPVEGQKALEPEKDDEPQDPPIPGKGEDWSDPKEEYSQEWLMQCAEAYGIKAKPNWKKATIIRKITAAMYD